MPCGQNFQPIYYLRNKTVLGPYSIEAKGFYNGVQPEHRFRQTTGAISEQSTKNENTLSGRALIIINYLFEEI